MRALPQAILDALASNVQAPSLQVVVKDTFDRPDMTATTIQSGDGGRSAMVQLRNGTYVQAYVNQPGLWERRPGLLPRRHQSNSSGGLGQLQPAQGRS